MINLDFQTKTDTKKVDSAQPKEHIHCSCGMESGSPEAYSLLHDDCMCEGHAAVSHCCFSPQLVEHEYLVPVYPTVSQVLAVKGWQRKGIRTPRPANTKSHRVREWQGSRVLLAVRQ